MPLSGVTFSGTREHRLDGKDRIVVPAPWANAIREESGGRVYLVQSRSPACLLVLPAKYYDRLAERHEPDPLAGATLEQRLFFHGAEAAELKGPGRITLPKRFLALFPSRVVSICGMSTYLELWDTAAWKEGVEAKSSPPAPSRSERRGG